MFIGDSVDVLVQEVPEHVYARLLKVDNTAAVNFSPKPPEVGGRDTSGRTRLDGGVSARSAADC